MFWRTGYDSRFFCLKAKTHNSMNNKKQSRRVSSKKLRALLNEITDDICAVQDKIIVSLTGNTFEIHLEGGSINITINEEGGRQ